MAGQPSIEQTKAFGKKMKNSRTRPYMWDGISIGADENEKNSTKVSL